MKMHDPPHPGEILRHPSSAIRLPFSKAFGDAPETWLRLQMQYDLWHAERRAAINVVRF